LFYITQEIRTHNLYRNGELFIKTVSNETVYLSVFNAFCVVDFPDMLLSGGSDLTHEVEMLRDGVRSVSDDMMLQH